MEKKPVLIIGAGGLGKAAQEIFTSNDIIVYGFLDEDEKLHDKLIAEVSVLGSPEQDELLDVVGDRCEVFIAADENSYRKAMVALVKEKRKAMPMNAIHKLAHISQSASVGYGNFIAAHSYIGAQAQIGSHCIINAGAIVDYEVKIEDFAQIGTGSNINGRVSIEENAFVGTGVTVVAGVTIGKGARVGAGSVVVKDVNAGETVFGNPAQKIK